MNNDKINQLISWYDHLSPSTLDQIKDFYADKTYFRDPFYEFNSLESLIHYYQEMFAKIKDPKFNITKKFSDSETNELVLFWDFHFMVLGKPMAISGNTHFKFNNEDKITHHIDYWDSVNELWMKTPIIGNMLKLFYKIAF
jgi:hypothetical protein